MHCSPCKTSSPQTITKTPLVGQRQLGRLGIFTLLFAATFTVMVGSLVTPALPAIALRLGFSAAPGWLVTLPALGVVLFAPLAGRIIDRMGARVVMLVGLSLYGLFGEGVVALGFSVIAVVVDRLLLGAATALVMTAGTMLIAEFFDGTERLKMIAWQGVAIEVGGVVFLALGGILGARGWRMPFLLYLLSWVCVGFVLLSIPQSARVEREAMSEGQDSANLLPTFLYAFLAMTIFFIAYITLPISLAARFRFGERSVGYFMAFISLMAVTFAFVLPQIAKVVPARRLIRLSFVLFGAGELLFAHAHTVPGIVLGAVATGAGFGFSIPTANHLVVEMSSSEARGRNLSYLSMAIFLGQFASSLGTAWGRSPDEALSVAGIVSLCVAAIAAAKA